MSNLRKVRRMLEDDAVKYERRLAKVGYKKHRSHRNRRAK